MINSENIVVLAPDITDGKFGWSGTIAKIIEEVKGDCINFQLN